MKKFKFKKNQKGAALAIGMMLLLIISVIGITSMKSALLQEKMAAGLKNRELADAAALTILAAGEKYLQSYNESGNGTVLSAGVGPVVVARSDVVHAFKSERNMNDGFTHPFGENLIARFNGELAEEPRFLIEDIENAPGSLGDFGAGGGAIFISTTGETGEGSSGSSSGSNSDSGDGSSGIGGLYIKKFRVVSKATDSTGYLYAGFESVVSVKPR